MARLSFAAPTIADATFTEEGAEVFNRLVQVETAQSPSPVWVLPDFDATLLYQGADASLASLRLTGQAYGSPSLISSRALFADDVGDITARDALRYNPSFINGMPALEARLPLHMSYTVRAALNGMTGVRSIVTVDPDSDVLTLASQTASQLRMDKIGTKAYPYLTAADIYATNRGTGTILALLASNLWAENEEAAYVQAIIGGTFIARQSHAGASSDDIIAALVDPSDGRDEAILMGSPGPLFIDPNVKAGVNVRFTGLKITGMNLDNMTTQARRALWIRPMGGTPSGSPDPLDLAIHSEATQTSRIEGPLELGKVLTSTGFLILNSSTGSGPLVLRPSSSNATWTGTFPDGPGTDGYFMRTNGHGGMTWDRVPAVMFGHANAVAVVAGAKQYAFPMGFQTVLANTEATRQAIAPCAFKLTNFKFQLITAQPSESPLILTLRINGVATALSITVPAGGAAGIYSTAGSPDPMVSVAPNDLLSIEFNNSTGSPGSASGLTGPWSIQVIPA